jgi:hypothetical protein
MASSDEVKRLFKKETLKEPKLVKMDVFYQEFTARHFKGKPVTGALVIEKTMSFFMMILMKEISILNTPLISCET